MKLFIVDVFTYKSEILKETPKKGKSELYKVFLLYICTTHVPGTAQDRTV